MRQLTLMRIWMLALASPLLAFPACSGDNTNGQDSGPDVTQGDVVAQDVAIQDSGPPDVNEAGPILDACAPIEGGAACDPAHIQCGATLSCTAGSQFCCIANEAGTFMCDSVAMPTMCQGNMMAPGTAMYCDEAANCSDAGLCCGYFGSGGGFASSCRSSCPLSALQLCHGNAECGSNGPCIGQTCHGVYIETCGGLAECP